MGRRARIGVAVAGLLAGAAGAAWPAGVVEIRLGGAWNAPLPLRIRQDGEREVKISPRWATRPFEFPLYYGVRVGALDDDGGWTIDLTHHKLHLLDPPPEVEAFAISHGYNLLALQRRFTHGRRTLGVGAGAVIAHPENRVRGESLDQRRGLLGSGYYVAGPSVDALGGTARAIGDRFHVSFELRVTLAAARVPVARGSASVPNLALHGTVGLGWRP